MQNVCAVLRCALEAQPQLQSLEVDTAYFYATVAEDLRRCTFMKQSGIHHEVYLVFHAAICAVECCEGLTQEVWHFHELCLLDSNAEYCSHCQWLGA